MRNVRETVTNKISSGNVLMTYKTKAGVGRKSVTVGPYLTAVSGDRWAVTIGGEVTTHGLPASAAEHFISYVGRDDAWEAAHGRGRQRNP